MDKKLLSILCCPVTRRQLLVARSDALKTLNTAIAGGAVSNRDGVVLEEALSEALVTDDGKLFYPVNDGIPVLLEGASINADQISGA